MRISQILGVLLMAQRTDNTLLQVTFGYISVVLPWQCITDRLKHNLDSIF